MSKGEVWNIDRLENWKLCLLDQLSLHHSLIRNVPVQPRSSGIEHIVDYVLHLLSCSYVQMLPLGLRWNQMNCYKSPCCGVKLHLKRLCLAATTKQGSQVLSSSPETVWWKLAWSGGFYQTRISVPLFTLLRSRPPHSARRQMWTENLANMPEMRFVIASRLWLLWHTNSRRWEACVRFSVSVCLCVPPHLFVDTYPTDAFGFLSKCFYDVNPECAHVCVLCKAAALYKTSRPAASLWRRIWSDSFRLQ